MNPIEARDEHLMALEFGLPVDQLRQQIRECLSGQSTREEIIVDATDRQRAGDSDAVSRSCHSRTAATAVSRA